MQDITIKVPEYVILSEAYQAHVDGGVCLLYRGEVFSVQNYNYDEEYFNLTHLRSNKDVKLYRKLLIPIPDYFINYIKEKN